MDDTNDHGVDTDLINLGDRVQVGGTWDDQPGWGTVILIEGLHEEFYVRMDDPDFRGANSHIYSYLGHYTVAYFAEHNDVETHKVPERTLQEENEILKHQLAHLQETTYEFIRSIRGA